MAASTNTFEKKDDLSTDYMALSEMGFFSNENNTLGKIAYDLIHRVGTHEHLAFLKENQEYLSKITAVEFRGIWIKGTITQISAALNEFMPHRGLTNLLQSCFKDQMEFVNQLNRWFDPHSEYETRKRMQPFVKAMEKFCEDIIETKFTDTEDSSFFAWKMEGYFKMDICENFRKAFVHNKDEVITSGLVFSLDILSEFIRIWKANMKESKLGYWKHLKSRLFASVVYYAIQSQLMPIDLEIFQMGLLKFLNEDEIPQGVQFSGAEMYSVEFDKIGKSFYFSFDGYRIESKMVEFNKTVFFSLAKAEGWGVAEKIFSQLISKRNDSRRELMGQFKNTSQNVRCLVM